MPITLACPSCTKRFRARDESAGKRVKCPFCQAAVTVPDEAPGSSADRPAPAPSDFAPPAPPRPAVPPPAPPGPALFDVVGRPAAPPPPPKPKPAAVPDLPPLPPPARPEPLFGAADPDPKPARPPKPSPPAKVRPVKAARPVASPEDAATAGWRGVKRGLFWVRFGLFWFALLGFVPFGLLVYERFKGELPKGDGAEWVKIDGYLNSPGPDAVTLNQRQLIEVAAYGVPILLGGLGIVLGRLLCGAAPRNSGARGLFACSGLLALVGFAGAATYLACTHVKEFKEVAGYGLLAAQVGVGLSEFWFLLALGAAAATLRRPAAVRAVGGYALVLGLAAVVVTVGWDLYLKHAPDTLGRPSPLDPDWTFYEAGAKMLGYLLVVGMYWRAVGGVRGAIREYLRDAEDATV